MADTVDVDELTVRLYSSAPEDFVKVRGEGVKQLKSVGDTEAAADFAKLAKPSLPAWAVNLLTAQRADLIDAVVQRGDELRVAHTGGGGPKEIRAAHLARQDTIRRATDAAVELAARQLSEAHRDDIVSTLEAASGDPAAASTVRAGRLVRPLAAPTGFGTLGGLTLITGGRAGGGRAGGGGRAAAAREQTTGAEADDEALQARASMLRAEADTALGAAESAGEAAAALSDQLAVFEAERERVDAELQRLDKQITSSRRQLRDAERAASDATRKAARAATRAERAESSAGP